VQSRLLSDESIVKHVMCCHLAREFEAEYKIEGSHKRLLVRNRDGVLGTSYAKHDGDV
jgi:hypothetical protein